jgi:hypothetical protein
MSDTIVSILLSAAIALLKLVVAYFVAWATGTRVGERNAYERMVSILVANDPPQNSITGAGHPSGAVLPRRDILAQLQTARSEELDRARRQAIEGVAPGPELCLLTLTMQMTLLFALSHAPSIAAQQALSPALASSGYPLEILLALVFINLALWLGTSLWRGAILAGLQKRFRGLSVLGLLLVGGAALTSCLYVLVAGR